jgi:ribosomal protein L16 Arg81 hydroxylase
MAVPADRVETARNTRSLPGLSQLIHPIDVATFLSEYWEQKPLLIHRDHPNHYTDLLSLDAVDSILATSDVRSDMFRVIIKGQETPVAELGAGAGRNGRMNALEELYARYRNGSTIVLNALEHRWYPLWRLSQDLGAEMDAILQMNVYLTPAGSQGFAPHYDTHDVFVAQLHGAKRWRLAMDSYALPTLHTPYDKSRPHPAAEQEFELRPGDIVYLPRGTIHWATSNETASLHVTMGVHPMTYEQVIEDAVTSLFAQDVRFRRGLPVGLSRDDGLRGQAAQTFAELVDLIRTRLAAHDVVPDLLKRAVSMRLPTLRHHLTDLEKLGAVWVDTPVRRRPDQRWHIFVTADAVSLEFHNKTIRLPVHVADEVRFVADTDGEEFTAADIPGDLDEPGRLVLIQTLLREGFITLG